MSFKKSIAMLTKMIMIKMMSQMRLKRKKVDYKRFELFDKLSKKLTLDEEIKEIENREKNVDKKRFLKHFSYEPTALVNKLLDQNTQDLIN